MKNGNYKINTESRLAKLEANLNEIMANHLPHIESKIDKLIWMMMGGLGGLVLVLITLLLKK